MAQPTVLHANAWYPRYANSGKPHERCQDFFFFVQRYINSRSAGNVHILSGYFIEQWRVLARTPLSPETSEPLERFKFAISKEALQFDWPVSGWVEVKTNPDWTGGDEEQPVYPVALPDMRLAPPHRHGSLKSYCETLNQGLRNVGLEIDRWS